MANRITNISQQCNTVPFIHQCIKGRIALLPTFSFAHFSCRMLLTAEIGLINKWLYQNLELPDSLNLRAVQTGLE